MTDAPTITRAALIEKFTGPGQEFEIVEHEINGIPWRVYKNGPQTLRDIALTAKQFGDRYITAYNGERVTYADHARQVLGLAKVLQEEHGLVKGDRIAVAMRNYPEWAPWTQVTHILGLVIVPLNAWWTAPELQYAIDDSGVKLVVADGERAAMLAPQLAKDGIPLIEVRPSTPTEGARQWSDLLASLDLDAPVPDVEVLPEDDATILYTSGTTGRPKGAVGTHRNHVTNLRNTLLGAMVSAAIANGGEIPEPDPNAPQPSAFCTFAMFHIAGVTSLGFGMMIGAKTVTQYKWDRAEASELVVSEDVTSIGGVPTVVRAVLEDVAARPDRYQNLTGISAGGAPVPPDLIDRIGSLFQRAVSPGNGYGLTETTSAVVSNTGDDYLDNPNSVGRCQPGTDVRVVEPDSGRDAPEGGLGELWFRGPNIVRGYWNNPEGTAAAFTDGWFHTGDIGRVEDGWVYVMDRMKDVVIRGGENIYCAEVEAVLYEHPGIEDVALIGIPHEELGEEAIAVVVPREGADLREQNVKDHVAQRLAKFKVPSKVVFMPEGLPRTQTGKVLKRDLRSTITAPQ
ncbi:MAG: class I adenylate-forming enzyme family protein [Cumulibacter sp.]